MKATLQLTFDGDLPHLQRVIGMLNRSKVQSESLEFQQKNTLEKGSATLTAILHANENTLDRLISQFRITADVHSAVLLKSHK